MGRPRPPYGPVRTFVLSIEYGLITAGVVLVALAVVAPGRPPLAWPVVISAGLVAAMATALYCRSGLLTPAVLAAFGLGLFVVEARYDTQLPIAGLLFGAPALFWTAGVEYAARRATGRLPARLAGRTERALAAGAFVGAGYLALVFVALPASDSLAVPVRSLYESGAGPIAPLVATVVDPVESLLGRLGTFVYAITGPVVVVGLPVTLAVRDRLASPLVVAVLEVSLFLSDPGAGDAVGSPSSLLWIYALALIAVLAVGEYLLRRPIARAWAAVGNARP